MHHRFAIASALISVIAGWFIVDWFTSGPELSVPEVVEIGLLDHGEFKKAVVRVTNVGRRPLMLQEPATGCTCTVAKLPKTSLVPGEDAEIEFVYHAAQAAGTEVNQRVLLNSNCRLVPSRQLVLHGKMRGSVFAAPASIHASIAVGKRWEGTIVVRHSDPASRFAVAEINCNVPGCCTAVG